jgi:murein DD-endopeptidase MepM/ murein hydrolase activator NlpD
MSDKKTNINSPDDNRSPLEMPDNNPPKEIEPIKSTGAGKARMQRKMKGVKVAYAISLLLLFGAALTAKLVSEQASGGLSVPIESDYATLWEKPVTLTEATEDPDFLVQNNLTDVPDTREDITLSPTVPQTEAPTVEETTESPYAKPYEDYFTLPLGTDVLKDYSPTTPSYNPTLGDWRSHGGIDFSAPDGSQVKSIAYGEVKAVYEDALYGTVIEIDHGNGVVARYCGMNKNALEIKAGDIVESGSLLGYLGTVPCEKSELSHLHFEIYLNGENVDPLALMNK